MIDNSVRNKVELVNIVGALITILGFASGVVLFIYDVLEPLSITLLILFLVVLFNTVESVIKWSAINNQINTGSDTLADDLFRIMNEAVRNPTMTRIENFLTEVDETGLDAGDEVWILTHDIQGYDLTEPAIRAISTNVAKNVEYKYFLPINSYPVLREHKEILRRKVKERTDNPKLVDENLKFYTIKDKWIYNFAVINAKQRSGPEGYWYTTTTRGVESGYEGDSNANLTIYELNPRNSGELYQFFKQLESRFPRNGRKSEHKTIVNGSMN